jgi:hypothetical protein
MKKGKGELQQDKKKKKKKNKMAWVDNPNNDT